MFHPQNFNQMKSLNEEIKDILTAKTSKAAKTAAFKKLGITSYEISLMLDKVSSGAYAGTTPSRYVFTFGVEIECGVSREALAQAANQTGMSYEYQGYNHRDGHNFFKFVTDGSLHLPDTIECVSPVLKGTDGKTALKNACKTLNKAGARVNRTCGLHVHIGADKLSGEQYANVFVNYAHLERLIDSFMAESRRATNAYYAQTLQDHLDSLKRCSSVSSVQQALGGCRYHKVNPMSYDRHKTIEFRQHQGTTDFNKIMNWASFCGKLVVWSKTNRLDADITSIKEIPFLTTSEKAFFKGRIAELNR